MKKVSDEKIKESGRAIGLKFRPKLAALPELEQLQILSVVAMMMKACTLPDVLRFIAEIAVEMADDMERIGLPGSAFSAEGAAYGQA